MDWLQYVILGLIVIFLASKLLPVKGLRNLSSDQLFDLLSQSQSYSFIDVREVSEYKRGHISGFQNIPLSQLSSRIKEIPQDRPVVLTCQSGMRSKQAGKLLLKAGMKEVSHLRTGMSGWTGKTVK